MKALVYRGPGKRCLEERSRPVVEAPWTDSIPEWSVRGVSYGPDEQADTAPIIFGGSVGMGPLLAVMQYYRTVVRPSFTPPRK